MNIFRIRDYVSVLIYRLAAPLFGRFGRRVRIVWPVRLVGLKYTHLEDDVTIANGGYVAVLHAFDEHPRLHIGAGTRLGEFAHIVCGHNITFGANVLVANRVFVSDCSHAYQQIELPVLHQGLEKGAPVVIGEGSWIGENACILSAKIGKHCVVGANSVIVGEVPDYSVVVGAPGRIVRRYCERREQWLPTRDDGTFERELDE